MASEIHKIDSIHLGLLEDELEELDLTFLQDMFDRLESCRDIIGNELNRREGLVTY